MKRHVRVPEPRRRELRTEGDYEQSAQALEALDEAAEKISRSGIDPVRIFQQRQDRGFFCQPRE